MRLPSKYKCGWPVRVGPNTGHVIAHFGYYNLIWWNYREWPMKLLWMF